MSDNKEKMAELLELLSAMREGTIGEDDFARLEKLVSEDAEMRKCYLSYVRMCGELRSRTKALDISEIMNVDDSVDLTDAALDEELWLALAACERNAVGVEVERPVEKVESRFIEKRKVTEHTRKFSRLSIYTAIVSTAALFLLLVLVWVVPAPAPFVATLTDSIGAEWSVESESSMVGYDIRADRIELVRGLAHIEFNEGTRVILQAPAVFELESISQAYLESGKISVVLGDEAEGFVIRTAGGTIVDYGTEFGVIAHANGQTEVHVYDGEVGLRSGPDPLRFREAIRLKVGKAGLVDAQGRLLETQFDESDKLFVREMPEREAFAMPGERISLADIVGGGNGFGTGEFGVGMNASTGEVFDDFSHARGHGIQKELGDYRYNEIAKLKYVDGVFVPQSGVGALKVTSAGDEFVNCPKVHGPYVSKGIINGAKRQLDPMLGDAALLDGKRYGGDQRPAILMRRNKGITFDLDAIRGDIPGATISRFTALCGVSETVLEFSNEDYMRACFLVLVDGKVRFKQSGVTPRAGGIPIRVELNDEDRFLTLVTTYSTMGGRNASLFGDPALEIE